MQVFSATDSALFRIAKLFSKKHAHKELSHVFLGLGIEESPAGDKFTKLYTILLSLYRSGQLALLGRVLEGLIEIHTLTPYEIQLIEKEKLDLGLGRQIPLDIGPYGTFALDVDTQKMIRAYVTLRTLENKLREFIDFKLRQQFGNDWWDAHSSKDIKNSVKRARQKEIASHWQSVRTNSEIYYTDFKDLKSLIIMDKNWEVFKGVFRDQTIVYKKLEELELVRNIVAHNRTLTDVELSRLEIYAHDVLKSIGLIKD